MLKNTNYDNSNESEFNEAVEQLKRIGHHWDLCHLYRRKGNLIQWNISLDCVWMELVSDMDEVDEEEIKKINENYIKNKENRDHAYQCLLNKEKFFRKLQEGQGKGGKKKGDTKGL